MIERFARCVAIALFAAQTAHAAVVNPTDAAFTAYNAEFRTRTTKALGPEAGTMAPTITAYVHRAAVARLLADAINNSDVAVTTPVPGMALGDLGPFDIRTGNVPLRGCRSNCDDDCRRTVLGIKVVDPVCWVGCELEKAGCEAVKFVEQGWSNKLLGRVSLKSATFAGGTAHVASVSVTISPNLTSMTLHGQLGGSGTASGLLSWVPELLVAPFCAPTDLVSQGKRLEKSVSIVNQDLPSLAIPLVVQERDGTLKVSFSLPTITPTVSVDVRPLGDLLSAHPESAVTCALPVAVGVMAQAFGEMPAKQIEQSVTYTLPSFDDISIGSITLNDGAQPLTAHAVLTGTCIGLVADAVQPKAGGAPQ